MIEFMKSIIMILTSHSTSTQESYKKLKDADKDFILMKEADLNKFDKIIDEAEVLSR
jgi:hypothetical protein